jgi:cephalosporin hydroxylase
LNWAEANREFFHSNVWATLKDDYGRCIFKYPTDLWIYREIIRRTEPAVIVETGSAEGGSGAWFADYAEVISIDIVPPDHPDTRVSWIRGSSLSTDIVDQVYERVRGRHCLVTLDSDHHAGHVLAELDLYAPLVLPGDYLVVEDTAVDEYDLDPEHYPNGGPGIAARAFLRKGTFEPDERCERFFLGMNPGGWLRRVA